LSKKHRVQVASRSLRDRLLAPAAAELIDRAGFEVSIEIAGDGDDVEHQIESMLEALAPAPAAYLRLQQLAALGELGAGVTHETRNILTAITGFAQIARQRGGDADASRRYLELIEREALRCVEILERFLAFSRAEPGETELVDVARVIEEVVTATRHSMSMQRIAVTTEIGTELPRVRCHRGELGQVALNLLINSMHATPAGGSVVITAKRAAVGGETGVEIAVADTGEGIAPELHERIFEAFFTTKSAGQGTGLGLALCRRIVTAAGGTINVESSPGSGARFVMRLPAGLEVP